MSVTIIEVRAALNDITLDELADLTVQQKIEDAEIILAAKITSPVSAELYEIAIRNYAAFLSFRVSNVFKNAKFGPLSVQRDIQTILNSLKVQSEEAIADASPSSFKLKIGYMFADRNLDIPTKAVL